MNFLKRLFGRSPSSEEEGEVKVEETRVVENPTTIIVVGDRGTGKTFFVETLTEGRRKIVFSRLSTIKGAKRSITLSAAERAKAEVLVVEDLPSFTSHGDLAKILALQRHLGIEEAYIVTQFLEEVEASEFRQATHLAVFRASLSVQKLNSYVNDYALANKIAKRASALAERQCFIVDLRRKVVSPTFINSNVTEVRKWIENPVEVEEETKAVEEVEVRVERLSVRQQILRLKRADRSLDHYEIAKILNITPNHAKKELSVLRRRGLID